MKKAVCPLVSLLLFAFTLCRADDGAASIGAGGIVLMKREPSVVMAKEILTISASKVTVEYEFRNDSSVDVTTEVAFPIPDYGFVYERALPGSAGFDDFRLWVEGKPTTFATQAEALVAKRNVTSLLQTLRIDPASFGHYREASSGAPEFPDVRRLSKSDRARLVALKLVDKDGEVPLWQVRKKYHWTQTFPAHGAVHIRHSYSPVLGGTNSVRYGLEGEKEHKKTRGANDKYIIDEIQSLCIEPALKKSLLDLSERHDMVVPFDYVDFILTTANTWKTPIEDFTLIVERPAPEKRLTTKTPAKPHRNEQLVSFCWNGPIEKTDPTHFTAHATNFIPTKELRVGFISVEQTDP